jgi:hypothetical protein
MYKVLSAESCSGGDTQQTAAAAAEANQKSPSKKPSINPPSIKIPLPSSASLLYPVVNKEVEQQFLGRGVTL